MAVAGRKDRGSYRTMKTLYTCIDCSTQLLSAGQHFLCYSSSNFEFFSHSYPDLVAPCFGLHPLQSGGGPEQRSVKPQVVKRSSQHPYFDIFHFADSEKREECLYQDISVVFQLSPSGDSEASRSDLFTFSLKPLLKDPKRKVCTQSKSVTKLKLSRFSFFSHSEGFIFHPFK